MKSIFLLLTLVLATSAFATDILDEDKGAARFVLKSVTPEINDCLNKWEQEGSRTWKCRRGVVPIGHNIAHALTRTERNFTVERDIGTPTRGSLRHNCILKFKLDYPQYIVSVQAFGPDIVTHPPTVSDANRCFNRAINQGHAGNNWPMMIKVLVSP